MIVISTKLWELAVGPVARFGDLGRHYVVEPAHIREVHPTLLAAQLVGTQVGASTTVPIAWNWNA